MFPRLGRLPGVRTRSSARRGFTLIELLVVVAIVALLVSILLPTLKRAREQGKLTVCVGNLRAIALGSHTYAAEDAQEQAVPVHPEERNLRMFSHGMMWLWGGKSGIGEPDVESDKTTSRWGTSLGRGRGSRPLTRVLYKHLVDQRDNPGIHQENWIDDYQADLPYFRCPSDRGYTGVHLERWKQSGLSAYQHYGTSYSPVLFHHYNSYTVAFHALSRIPNPANTVYYLDTCGRFAYFACERTDPLFRDLQLTSLAQFTCMPEDAEPRVKGWHGRPFHFSTAFVDGHVSLTEMSRRTLPPPHLSHYPLWYHPFLDLVVDCDGLCDYNEFSKFIVRGPGWQLDILPAQTARTVWAEDTDGVIVGASCLDRVE